MDREKFLKIWFYQPVDGEIMRFLVKKSSLPTAGWDPGYHPAEVTMISDLTRIVDGILIRRIEPDCG